MVHDTLWKYVFYDRHKTTHWHLRLHSHRMTSFQFQTFRQTNKRTYKRQIVICTVSFLCIWQTKYYVAYNLHFIVICFCIQNELRNLNISYFNCNRCVDISHIHGIWKTDIWYAIRVWIVNSILIQLQNLQKSNIQMYSNRLDLVP